MARALCAHGLLPALGIHHDNNLNQFCLADDLFEIYRPIVDVLCFKLWEEGKVDIITITDKQYEGIISYKSQEKEQKKQPEQLLLF